MSAQPDDAGLQAAFAGLTQALATGDLDSFYGVMDAEAAIFDEDLPFPVNRKGFQDHISFHGPQNWEGFAWKPLSPAVVRHGATGLVMGNALFRGKPRDSGFRLRPMMFSQGWAFVDGAWKLVSWHQSPVIGHVTNQCPG